MSADTAGGLTRAQRAKMAQRLRLRHDRSDLGELLPETERALAMPFATVRDQADRAVALANALATERVIVPVPVEAHPDQTGEHRPQGLGEHDHIPLPVLRTVHGDAVVAFSSADALAQWDPDSRPMTMSSQRVATLASQMRGQPSIVVDPASSAPVTLPVGAVHALIGGDKWLAPWTDEGLKDDLFNLARAQCADVVSIRISPSASTPVATSAADARSGQYGWPGPLNIELVFKVDATADFATQREALANAIAAASASPRLASAAPAVSFTPLPAAAV